jgi:hypothetical protein
MATNETFRIDPKDPPTFEKVWAALMEDREQMKELRELQKRTDEQIRRTGEQMKETDYRIGGLGSRIGDLIEVFAASNVLEKFRAIGFTFTRICPNMRIKDKNGKDLTEIDLVLENGDSVMVVEVKTVLKDSHADEHIKRMHILHKEAVQRNDMRNYYGAIAAARIEDGPREYVLRSGFYLIEQTGDNVRINTPEHPKLW